MPYREELPYDKGPDNTLSFLNEGYEYITNRRERFNRDMFRTRLLGGKQVICMGGEDAARVFYDNDKFKRHGAAPKRVVNTLFGKKGVQTLDGKAHTHRKSMFMNLMTRDSLGEIADLVEAEWMKKLGQWKRRKSIVLYQEVKSVLSVAICRWTGVPTDDKNIAKFSQQLADMFESAGKVGPKHIKGKRSRKSVEKWLMKWIDSIRKGEHVTPEHTPFHKIATHRELDGSLLDKHTAAVEVLNLLRPTVAISVYVALSALALHDYPLEKNKLKTANETYHNMFIQEVRRYYPFFPVAIATVKKEFLWGGHDFKAGTLVMLDLYGTSHHHKLWERPNEFIPERFKEHNENLFDLIPQGGGNHFTGHRCAGEWLTIEVMKRCLNIMVNKMDYTVPKQDLSLSMKQMPSVPKSGFIMKRVHG